MAILHVDASHIKATSWGNSPPKHVCISHGTVKPWQHTFILHSNLETLIVWPTAKFEEQNRSSQRDTGESVFWQRVQQKKSIRKLGIHGDNHLITFPYPKLLSCALSESLTAFHVSGFNFSNGTLVSNLAVVIRHLPKLETILVGRDKSYQDWDLIKYPKTFSLFDAVFKQRNLVNILIDGYFPSNDMFLVELLKRYLTCGKQSTCSFLRLGNVKNVRLGVRLIAELAKGPSQVKVEFGSYFRLLIGEVWHHYLSTNQIL